MSNLLKKLNLKKNLILLKTKEKNSIDKYIVKEEIEKLIFINIKAVSVDISSSQRHLFFKKKHIFWGYSFLDLLRDQMFDIP